MNVNGKISTHNLNSRSREFITRMRGEIGDIQRKISEDAKKDDFSEVSLEHEVASVLANLMQISALEDRSAHLKNGMQEIQFMESNINSIIEVLNDATRWLYTAYNPIDGQSIDVQASAENTLNSIESILKSSFNGVFLFGGRDTVAPPVEDLAGVANHDADWVFNANYYNGDANDRELRLNDGNMISIPVQANDKEFKDAIGALHMARIEGGKTTPDTDVYRRVIGIINESKNSLASTLTTLGNKMSEIDRQLKQDEVQVRIFSESLNEKLSYDPMDLIVEFTQQMTMMQAGIRVATALNDSSMQVATYIRV